MSKKKTPTNSPLAQAAEETDSKKLSSPEDDSEVARSAIINQDELSDQFREADQALDLQEVKEITDDELQKELKRFLIPKLRSASYRWSERSKAIKAARVSRGLYKCAMCGDATLKNGEFVMDHTIPVVAFEGWDGNWDTYVKRMFVKAEDFQALCKPCHTIKSDTEVQIRKMHRERKKREKDSPNSK